MQPVKATVTKADQKLEQEIAKMSDVRVQIMNATPGNTSSFGWPGVQQEHNG